MDDLAGTYFVLDKSNQEELKRLIVQERMTVRIVEGEVNAESSSTALSTFEASFRRGFQRAGYIFEETPPGLVDHLPALLLRHDFQNIQIRKTPVVYQAGTEAGKALFEDLIRVFHTIRPFLQRYGCLPQDYDALCQQATQDMQQSDFAATLVYYTFCATNSSQAREGLLQREMPM
jgi:hypothetical protein